MTNESVEEEVKQLSLEEAQLIVSMRIYDVLMVLLTATDGGAALALAEAHEAGRIIGAPISWSPED